MNEVLKVIRDGNIITLIIRTEGEEDFWHWSLTDYEFIESLKRTNHNRLVSKVATGIDKKTAEIVANDPDNDIVGVSCGGFDTVGLAICDVMGWDESVANAIDNE